MTAALQDLSRPGYESCTGCKLCVLPCPVFQQTRDLSLTLMGRAKATQGGAGAPQIAASLSACVLCGACEPVCPEEIDTVGRTLAMRQELGGIGVTGPGPRRPEQAPPAFKRGAGVLLAGEALAESGALPSVRAALGAGVEIAVDDGRDIAFAIEAGRDPGRTRVEQFADSLSRVREVIVAEGILVAPLQRLLPGVAVRGLGESLLRNSAVVASISKGDFLVIETRAFHAAYSRLIGFYDRIRVTRGVEMNLDLHRIAIPTGASSIQARTGAPSSVDSAEQVRWLLEGRAIRRVVTESVEDAQRMAGHTTLPVVHLTEFLRERAAA